MRPGAWLVRTTAVAALAVLLAGCWWNQAGYDSHRTGFNPLAGGITSADAPDLEVEWATPDLLSISMVRSQTGLLHVLGDELTTVDPETGSVVWSADVDWDDLGVPDLVAVGSVVYVPLLGEAGEGCLARFEGSTGADLGCLPFAVPTGGPNVEVGLVARSRWIAVAAATYGGSGSGGALTVVDTAQPERSWSVDVIVDAPTLLSNPLIIGGEVVLASQADADPQALLQRWPMACESPCSPTSSVPLTVQGPDRLSASADGTRLAIQGMGEAAVLSYPDVAVLWSADLADHGDPWPWVPPTWTPTSVVFATVGDDGSHIHRFPATGCGSATCSPTWTAHLDGFLGGQVAATADVFVASAAEQPLVVLPDDCSDPCEPIYELEGWTFWGAPVLDLGRIFVTGFLDLEGDGTGTTSEELVAVTLPA